MKYFISHRGNLNGKKEELENDPKYIDVALQLGFDVEIDIWVIDDVLFLGHDKPQYKINQEWLNSRYKHLWIHCKNIKSMEWFNTNNNFNYFWHQEDEMTLTSKNFIWVYPGKQPVKNSISVMPEINNDNVLSCIGVCSDFIEKYKK
jgi:hypothetical protein